MGETKQHLVRFYDLSGPKPWSPACWCTRYALNYKGIPYETSKYSLDKTDGSREFFRRTREERLGCLLSEIVEKKCGGEEKCLENLKQQWLPLKERMANEDGTGERKYSSE